MSISRPTCPNCGSQYTVKNGKIHNQKPKYLTTHPAQASHNYLLFQNVFADDSTDVRVVGCRNCHHHPAILAFYDEDVIPHHLIEFNDLERSPLAARLSHS